MKMEEKVLKEYVKMGVLLKELSRVQRRIKRVEKMNFIEKQDRFDFEIDFLEDYEILIYNKISKLKLKEWVVE